MQENFQIYGSGSRELLYQPSEAYVSDMVGWCTGSEWGLIASETFENYAVSSSTNFNDGYGWATSSVITQSYVGLVAFDTFDYYNTGSNITINSGSGWSSSMVVNTPYLNLVAYDTFEEYNVWDAQFNKGYGWL